jgi:hypothetical protein
MVRRGGDRSSLVVAFGGGIVGDMAGFLAAIFMRGIPVLQVPTTLLAQVDASLGGKTGVNLVTGKNLIGSFHQPLAVLIDPALLDTLPEREYRAGLHEIVKAGIIREPDLFRFLADRSRDVLARQPQAVDRIIADAVRMKCEVVSADEREGDLRRILNFGHTFGHALEAETGYTRFLHGEAVAFGMRAAACLGQLTGHLSAEDTVEILEMLRLYGPIAAARRHPGRQPPRAPRARQENRARQSPFCGARAHRRGRGGFGHRRNAGARIHPVRPLMKGAAPQGARNEREAAAWVRGMFARVARRYDVANHLLSFNIDRLWRARTVRRVRPILERPGARVLDICCGTGDLTLALARECRTPILRFRLLPPHAASPRVRKSGAAAPARAYSKPTPSACRCATLRSTSSPWLSVSATWRTIARASPKCAACCAPTAWPPSWNSPNRPTPSSPRSTTSIPAASFR